MIRTFVDTEIFKRLSLEDTRTLHDVVVNVYNGKGDAVVEFLDRGLEIVASKEGEVVVLDIRGLDFSKRSYKSILIQA